MVRAGGVIAPPTTAFRWYRAANWAFSPGGLRDCVRTQPAILTVHRKPYSRREAVAAEAAPLTGGGDPTRLAARGAREKRNPAVGRTAGPALVRRRSR
jgi:hypothetical protein